MKLSEYEKYFNTLRDIYSTSKRLKNVGASEVHLGYIKSIYSKLGLSYN